MFQYHCLNPIAAVGLDLFSDDYQTVSYTHLTLPTT